MFFKNICRFNQCGLEFATLYDLIQHIEEIHIVNDAEHQKQFELLQRHGQQQAPIVPLSYICRHFQKLPDRKPKAVLPEQTMPSGSSTVTLPKKRPSVSSVGFSGRISTPPVVQVNFQPPATPSVASSSITSVGSELEEDNMSVDNESLSSDSTVVDDSVGDQNYSNNRFLTPATVEERKFACPVPGCKKKYKNINGVRYHAKIAHQGGDQTHNLKAYKCGMCNKGYKTSHGLQNHQLQNNHKPTPSPSIVAASASAPLNIQQMKQQQQQQHAFPLTLLTSSSAANAATGGSTIRVSPAPSPSLILAAQQQTAAAGIKLTSTAAPFAGGAMPSGVSIQVQPAVGGQLAGGTTTTVHVPQQGAAAAASGGGLFNVSVLGSRSTYGSAAAAAGAGIKRSSSYAQLAGSGRPLKMSAHGVGQLGGAGHKFVHMVAAQQQQQQQQQQQGADTQMPVISNVGNTSTVASIIQKQ